MGGLGTSIIGRPRPSPPHRRAAPGHPTATPWIGKSRISAPLLTRADDLGALLIALQVLAMLLVIGILERVGDHTK